MRRGALSRPLRLALAHAVLRPERSLFDYGCGRGDDVARLRREGFAADGWDPAHQPDAPRHAADVVNLGYVVNVIEDAQERRTTLEQAWRLAKAVLVVSARLHSDRDGSSVAAYRDGWVTRHGTFQRYFEHEELGSWIDEVLSVRSVAAGPGVFYVFHGEGEREAFLSSRFRRPVTISRRARDATFERHRDTLEPLIAFVATRGRLPEVEELGDAGELLADFGSVRRAFRVVLWVTDQHEWDRLRQERSIDLLVHLALAHFHGRSRFGELPRPMQLDVRAFFPSYRQACDQADRLLFAAGNAGAVDLAARAATVGKLTGNALYVHVSALSHLPALLRIYEGCARAYIGTVEGANVVKLARRQPQVSYLSYPDFKAQGHPALDSSVVVALDRLRVSQHTYSGSDNPPVLHRKEALVHTSHPLREKFARLTAQEERLGLYEHPEAIGTRQGWGAVLQESGKEVRGHRVVRLPPPPSL